MPRLISATLKDAKVGHQERISTGVDVVGSIAIVRLGLFSRREKREIGTAMLERLGNVRGVFEQEGGVEGELRLRKLRHLAGEKGTLTTHRENGCVFKVDVAKCYFSPRLSTERLRVAGMVRPKEKVLNMFAGVGPFSIPIAKKSGARVTSCEIGKYASALHLENDIMNKVEGLVKVVNADAMDLPNITRVKFDRILMPHPSQASRFLPVALELAGKGAVIHYYRHVLGSDEEEAALNLDSEISEIVPPTARYTVRKVREVGPRWLEMAAEIRFGARREGSGRTCRGAR